MNDFVIRTIWSNEITPEEIKDFRFVLNSVFNNNFCTEEYFKAKYLDNIYGPSLHFLAYSGNKPVGAMALWRNDIGGREAYQNADISVLQDFRKNGVFGSILKREEDFISTKKGILFYVFPNHNSFPSFVRAGWQVKTYYRKRFIPGISSEKQLSHIDPDYAKWWLIRRAGICHIRRKTDYYLIVQRIQRTSGFNWIIGRTDEKTARLFPESKSLNWILYASSDKRPLFDLNPDSGLLNNPDHVVFRNVLNPPEIPVWKKDSIKGRSFRGIFSH